MAYTEHTVVKPEKLVETGAMLLEQSLTLPNLMQKESFDAYKGARGDAVNIKIDGVLPFHNYPFRNDRSTRLVVDTYEERTIQVSLGDNFYSNVHLTDEQKDFDLIQWGKVLSKQSQAIGRGLQRAAAQTIEDAPYQVVIGGAGANLRASLNEARRVLNKFQVPEGERFLVVGSDFEAAMLDEEKLVLAQNVGDARADTALGDAIIGRIAGFTVVLDNTMSDDAAFAFVDGGFVWANAAPTVPNSAPVGSTTSYEGVAMRLIQDYDSQELTDRQVVNTWSGMRYVEDILVGWNEAGKIETISEDEHFVRGIKLTLDGESVYPTVGGELATVTGVSAAKGFEGGVRTDLTA